MNTHTPIYGNYHGYYLKRPFVTDPRLALFPKDFFAGKRVLDVGCNEGHVACEIAQTWGARSVVGVDIDESLVRAAWKKRISVWTAQGSSSSDAQPDYFPSSFEHVFGPLPIPPTQAPSTERFPNNISFRSADWVKAVIPEDAEQYDVIIGFSITKWIHLNQGDEGIRAFFQRAHASLRVGGAFILEPQAWDTYKKAKRMDKTLKEKAATLTLRPEGFETILKQLGFQAAQHFGVIGEGGFRRPIDLYVKV